MQSMNKLIVIVGMSGVGKTTLANTLAKQTPLVLALEQHTERPFQALFKQDARYALANQLDYLLYRAEQERELRSGKIPAIMDGGLDLDFYGFTRLFHAHGWLTDEEYRLCQRFHAWTRSLLPAPDLVIALSADEKTISERLASRNRINIASEKDAALLSRFLNEWLDSIPQKNLLRLDVSKETPDYQNSIKIILERLEKHG
jgi:deoxyadenosine/deoxycytidine kinase